MAQNKNKDQKDEVQVGVRRYTDEDIISIGKARRDGDSPVMISERMSIPLVTVRNILSSLAKNGVRFPKVERSKSSRYVGLADQLK